MYIKAKLINENVNKILPGKNIDNVIDNLYEHISFEDIGIYEEDCFNGIDEYIWGLLNKGIDIFKYEDKILKALEQKINSIYGVCEHVFLRLKDEYGSLEEFKEDSNPF